MKWQNKKLQRMWNNIDRRKIFLNSCSIYYCDYLCVVTSDSCKSTSRCENKLHYYINLHTSSHARARDCPLPVHLRDVPAARLLRLRSLLLHQEQDRVRPQQRAHQAQGQGGLCAETGVNIIVIRSGVRILDLHQHMEKSNCIKLCFVSIEQ